MNTPVKVKLPLGDLMDGCSRRRVLQGYAGDKATEEGTADGHAQEGREETFQKGPQTAWKWRRSLEHDV